MDAAARVFVSAGLQGATMRAIADAAGFTASSLYTYFESKEEIFEALHAHLGAEIIAVIQEPMPTGLEFPQRFELLLMRLFSLVEKQHEAYALFCSEGQSRELNDGRLEFVGALARWFESNLDTAPAEMTFADLGYFFWGIGQGVFVQWLDTPGGDLAARVPLVKRLFLKGIS